jgi:hypothetical protein
MRKVALATVSLLCVLVVGACEEPLTDLDGENTCVAMTGLYTASQMTAVGTENPDRTHNFLGTGGSFTINFGSGQFTSNYRLTPVSTFVTRTGTYVSQNGTIILGNETLFPGAAAGTQLFACAANGKNLTLIAVNSSYTFDGDPVAQPARITIVMSKP